MMGAPYTVLTRYRPGTKDPVRIGKVLTDYTARHGLVPFQGEVFGYMGRLGPWYHASWFNDRLHAEVRDIRQDGADHWHQDAGDFPEEIKNHATVLWSTEDPTEFRASGEIGGRIFQPRPYEVVLVRNLNGVHRRPPDSRPRLFFRQRVEIPSHIVLP